MLHLRLCKGLSYSGVVSATKDAPDVFVEDEAAALAAVSTGYFKIMEDASFTIPPAAPSGPVTTLDAMTVLQLRLYADANGIDLTGATRKDEILSRIADAQKKNMNDSDSEDNDPSGQFTGGEDGQDESGAE